MNFIRFVLEISFLKLLLKNTIILINRIIFYSFMELVALLSSGKGTWGQVSGLMKQGEWDKIFILGDDFAKGFTHEKPFEFIKVDLNKRIKDLKEEFKEKLNRKFEGLEVSVSLASGDGKEHMALISALIDLPMGVRFVALTKEGIINL
jgi:hypothetical protein